MPLPTSLLAAFREFRRYTGDGLPGEPVNAPLPVGDPQSGVNNPKKSAIRDGFQAVLDYVQGLIDDAEIGIPADGGVTRPKLTAALSSAVLPSVKEYGALGNGVANDTAAITAALTATAGQVYFPPGTYVVNASMLANHLRCVGDGEFKIGNDFLPVGPWKDSRPINVPGTFATLAAAWEFAQAKEITNTGLAVIQLANGTYDNVPMLEARSPYGDRVRVIGNVANPALVTIRPVNAAQFAQFLATRNFQIGFIDGVTLESKQWTSHGVWSGYSYGIFATQSGSIAVGASVRVNKWYWGIAATLGGTVSCAAGVVVNEAGDGAYFARENGTIVCSGCIATNAADIAQALGYGFIAELGGTLYANDTKASGCDQCGYYANAGQMWAHNGESFNNAKHGFWSVRRGYIEALNGNSHNNGLAGFKSEFNSYIMAFNADAVANGQNGFHAIYNSSIEATNGSSATNTGYGYRVEFLSTIVRYGASGTGNTVSFDSQTINVAGGGGWILG